MQGAAKALIGVALALALVAVGVGPVRADIAQQGTLRVKFGGGLHPGRLPRTGFSPVAVSLSGEISTTDRSAPPQLERLVVAINRHGRLDLNGVPRCHYHQLQPSSTAEALASCPGSLIGSGTFNAAVNLPEQSPFPQNGTVGIFNGLLHGETVLYAHIFGKVPVPISQVIVFHIRHGTGGYGVTLAAELPQVAAEWGHVSGLSMRMGRVFRDHGHLHSVLSAGCPAPKGFDSASFTFARASFTFADGRTLRSSLVRTCRVRP